MKGTGWSRCLDNPCVSPFFELAYALVIFLVLALVGSIPGALVGLVGRDERRLWLPAVPLALAGWIWVGWLGSRYGISRVGLVLYSAVAAAGFVRGWRAGVSLSIRGRRRQHVT